MSDSTLDHVERILPLPLNERIPCSRCGKSVSTPVPAGTLVRAWVECPECVATHWVNDNDLSAALSDASQALDAANDAAKALDLVLIYLMASRRGPSPSPSDHSHE